MRSIAIEPTPLLEHRVGSREVEELRIDIEQLNGSVHHADAVADHAFRDSHHRRAVEGDGIFLYRRCFSVGREAAGREKHAVIVVPLYCTAEFIDFRTAYRVVAPPLSLECRSDRHDSLTNEAAAVDTAIGTAISDLQLLVSKDPSRETQNCSNSVGPRLKDLVYENEAEVKRRIISELHDVPVGKRL